MPYGSMVRRRARQAAPTALDLTLLAGFWLLFFWQIIVARDHLIPFDLIDQHYMFQAFIHRALANGEAPWWAPEILSGYPIVADPLTALFYPPNLLMHLLTRGAELPYLRLEFQVTLHYLWAAMGTYALARGLTGSRPGALIAALTFAFGAFFAWHAPHLSPISSLSWLPWILFAFERAVRLRSPGWTGAGALAFGMMILAGHALTILQTGYLLAGLTALLAIRWWSSKRRQAVLTLAIGGAILALGAGLAMVQLALSWELSGVTERADLAYADATGSSYLPQWIVTAVLPNFYAASDPAVYWAAGDIAETNMYAGLVALVLAAVGLIYAKPTDRPMTLLVLGGGILAFLVALGSHAWLYRIAFDVLPGVDQVRRPLNAIAFVHLALGLLAAYGVKALVAAGPNASDIPRAVLGWLRRILAGIAVLLALAALALAATLGDAAQPAVAAVLDGIVIAGLVVVLLYVVVRAWTAGHLSERAAVALLVLVAAFDLGTANAAKVYQEHATRPDSYIGADWAGDPADLSVRFLREERDAIAPDRARIYPNRAGSIWANGPLVWQLESAYGYSVLWPLEYRELHDVATADPGKPLIDLMNIRFLVLPESIETIYPQAQVERYRLVHQSSVQVYENPAAGTRVRVLHEAISLPPAETLLWMEANADALEEVVVINEPLLGRSAAGVASRGSAEILRYENTRVAVHATLPEAGWVVLFDAYYPGWKATVDGEPAELLRGDHTYRAVWVAQGEHEIEFSYSPAPLRWGLLVSALSGLAIAGLLIAGLVPRVRARRGRRSN